MTDSQFAATITLLGCLLMIACGYGLAEYMRPDVVPCSAEVRDGGGNVAILVKTCRLEW